jgi:opacity protein-like surface antigen
MNASMNKTIFVAALFAATAVAAFAGSDDKDMKSVSAPEAVAPSDAGVYLAAFGGADFAQDFNNGRVSNDGFGINFAYHTNNSNYVGGVGGLKVGYNFESFPLGGVFRLQPAVEGEAFYLGSKVNLTAHYPSGDPFNVEGHMSNAAFMVNGLLRLKTGTCFTPYIGAGIGVEYMTFSRPFSSEQGLFNGSYPVQKSADALAFAVQAIAGFDIEITKNWSFFTEYKFVGAIDPAFSFGQITFSPGTSYNLNVDSNCIEQHLATVGVKYQF